MILICGSLADTVTEFVRARLQERGYAYRLLDLGTYPAGFQVNWHWQGAYPTGFIATSEWKLYLEEVSGIYARYLGGAGRVPLPNVAPELAPAIYTECDTGLVALFEHLPCVVINRMSGGLSNHSKPFQALLIRESGLLIPPILVTSDPEEARRFYDEFKGDVICKSLSGGRSIVRRISEEQLARLPLLANGPAHFQAFIPGENVRVHTVGDELFATRVRSESVDYRYAWREGNTVEMEAMKLPDSVAQSCLKLARKLDLLIAGIDLKVTRDGQYYCFEINPSPGFTHYEQRTRQPISAALADLLRKGTRTTVATRELSYGANVAAMPAF